jgi:transcriptional regulator with XRE-family HTH domain
MNVPAVEIEARRRQSGAFLRSRRERLRPCDVGLPNGFRRRTPGLRREEVALLAGVGTTWYTWLEQGRDVSPSAEVLAALADALKLDPAERRHLFILNDRPAPEQSALGLKQIPEPLQRMLDSLSGQPAHILGRRWDILAWNRAAVAVFGDYTKLVGDERNIMHLLFANRTHRRLLVDWDMLAPACLAMFRADYARYAGTAEFESLVATLNRVSAEFRQWWPRHEVLRPLSGHKRIEHPACGRMTFEYMSFAVTDQGDMKLIVYTPLTTDQTADKLDALLRNDAATRCCPEIAVSAS